jgi:hypothetical protein
LLKTQLPSLPQQNLRWLALKLLENEADLVTRIHTLPGSSEIIDQTGTGRCRISRM